MFIVPRPVEALYMPGVEPLEVGLAAVDLHVQQPGRLAERLHVPPLVRRWAFAARRGLPARAACRRSAGACETVRRTANPGAGVPIVEPPEPVAPLGDVQLVPGLFEVRGRNVPRGRLLDQVLAGLREQVPRLVARGMADPDAEVVADPTAGEQVSQPLGGRMLFQVVADPLGVNLRMPGDAVIERAEEVDAAVVDSIPSSFRRRE